MFFARISWNTENQLEPYQTMLLFSFQESLVYNIYKNRFSFQDSRS